MTSRVGQRWHEGYLQPCGTPAAYRRHMRHGEKACEACRQAEARRGADYRAAQKGRAITAAPEWDGQPSPEHRREEWAS